MGGKTPGKQEPQSCMLSILIFQVVKDFTVVYFDSIHRRRMDFISFMEGKTSDKQEPQCCMLQTQFSESGSFESSIVRQ